MWKREENAGVSTVIAVILMVAITVVLAGVLYVWLMGFIDNPEAQNTTIGLLNKGQEKGYYTLEVATIKGTASIDAIEVELLSGGMVVERADISAVSPVNNGSYDSYWVPSSTPGHSHDFIGVIDNNQDGYLNAGDVVKVDRDLVQTGYVVQIRVNGNPAGSLTL